MNKKPVVGVALKDRLGDDATHDFRDYIDECSENWRIDVIDACGERMDLRIERFALKDDLVQGLSAIRQEMATLRVEWLRWSFAFWIGQVAVTVGLVALLVKSLQR